VFVDCAEGNARRSGGAGHDTEVKVKVVVGGGGGVVSPEKR